MNWLNNIKTHGKQVPGTSHRSEWGFA